MICLTGTIVHGQGKGTAAGSPAGVGQGRPARALAHEAEADIARAGRAADGRRRCSS